MVSFNNIPRNINVPLFYAELDNSKAFQFNPEQKTLIVGQRLTSGIASVDEIILVASASQAREYFGVGSHLATMVEAYRDNDPFTELWCLPVDDDGAAVAATGTVVVSGPATSSGTINLYIAGERILVSVTIGDTATAIAAAIVDAISEKLPLSAAINGGDDTQIDFTARNKGALGNEIDIRENYYGLPGGEKTPDGVVLTITAMNSGTTNPDLSTPLSNIGDQPFNYIIHPFTDAISLTKIRDFMDDKAGRWSWEKQIYGHVFSARTGTVSELNTFGDGLNDPHISILGYHDSPTSVWQAAAMFGAQSAKSLSIDPARPLQTLPMIGFLPPPVKNRFRTSEANILLNSGVSTSYTEGGYVRIQRAITTYQENAYGQPDTSYLDVQTLATLSYILKSLQARITQKFGRHKLANNGTRFGPNQAIVTPNVVRSELIASYAEFESEGLVENATAFKENLLVERDQNDPNRLNIVMPPDLVNQLRIFAVLAQFRLQYPIAA
ncbi:MAG: phage tail sheath C-terminal domain-containing protein [Sneathiella sp.]